MSSPTFRRILVAAREHAAAALVVGILVAAPLLASGAADRIADAVMPVPHR